jgi:hypothetical protein
MRALLLPSLLLTTACDDKGDDSGDSSTTPVAFSACTAYDSGSADVSALSVSGDTLSVEVGYGGGCEDHQFTVCWPDQVFAESEPVQASLALWHEANGDSCEAYLTEVLDFDLTPMKEAWIAGYGGSTGTMILNLEGQSASYSF